MKVALVHDYLIRFGGAEQVLLSLHRLFPQAPIYTLIYDKKKMGRFFPRAEIRPSFFQKLPGFLRQRYKYFLPFLPIGPETFDLREFDLIISSSSAFAKAVITRSKTIHICYCHNPMRFVWDWHYQYLAGQELGFLTKIFLKPVIHYLRLWDRSTAYRVDYFIANSKTTQSRIWKFYRRDSQVIYPPVDIENSKFEIRNSEQRQRTKYKIPKTKDYFLIVSQLTPYKRLDLAVEAFNKLELPLVIIGEGPERKKLERIAGPHIKFLGFQSKKKIRVYYQNCAAFVFPGEDDFGIAPVEAMSFGKPVLAFRAGGATESVLEGITGEFFDSPNPAVLADGARRLRENLSRYSPLVIRKRAEKFSRERFEREIKEFINKLK